MNRIVYICILFLFSCSSEDVNNCIQTAGTITQKEVVVPSFTRILVNRDIELIISEGDETKVIVESGKNLLNDIEVTVVGNQLQLTNQNTCNYVRDYGITKIMVTAPNLNEIRSSSQFDVRSQGLLNYPSLSLVSEDFAQEDAFAVGDFRLTVAIDQLSITSNKLSSFYILGQTEDLVIGFYGGAGRFEGADLVAQNITVFHRGSNDMIVNPQLSIEGELRSTGNIIAVNRPAIVNVESYYTGRLIFD